ncbi:MAG: histidinol-phosphatase HisJ family protein [Lachnospiraceae bacterium]|nr:histidinol-phosphatase HisJ family protein [Lachnospiraceae bacterium]
MLNDCHIHTHFSSDSTTPPRAQIERAISLGMERICITDHNDYDAINEEGMTFLLDVERYLLAMQTLQIEYRKDIELLIGIEQGLQLHLRDYYDEFSKNYAGCFDYIIGSSHFIDRQDLYYPSFYQGHREEDCYAHYFDISTQRILLLDDFDSFGHLDYIVRYGPNKNANYSYAAFAEYIDPLLKALIKKRKALEINSAGYKYQLGVPNPHPDIICRYKELGGTMVTIGSDAHQPEYIGHHFDDVAQILLDCGFIKYTIFRKRQPIFLPIL